VRDAAAAVGAGAAPHADVDRELVAGADREVRDDGGAEAAVPGVLAVAAGAADDRRGDERDVVGDGPVAVDAAVVVGERDGAGHGRARERGEQQQRERQRQRQGREDADWRVRSNAAGD
jgi:hypothetical protein